jgi:sulfiredoxin
MMRRATLAIADIYVPVKRRATLDQKRVDEIAASILDKGLQTPILVRADGARFVLVEGLHRLEAAKALGEETIVGFCCRGTEALARRNPLRRPPLSLKPSITRSHTRRLIAIFLFPPKAFPHPSCGLRTCRQLALVGISKCARSM